MPQIPPRITLNDLVGLPDYREQARRLRTDTPAAPKPAPSTPAEPLDPGALVRNPDVNEDTRRFKDKLFGPRNGVSAFEQAVKDAAGPQSAYGARVSKAELTRALTHLSADGKVDGFEAAAAQRVLTNANLTPGAKQAAAEFLALVNGDRPVVDASALRDSFASRYDKGPFTQISLPESARRKTTQGMPDAVKAEYQARLSEDDMQGEVRLYRLELAGQPVLVVNKEYEADATQTFALFTAAGKHLGTATHGDMGGFEWLSR